MTIIKCIPKLITVFMGKKNALPQSNLQLFLKASLTFYGQAGLFFGGNKVQRNNNKKGE